MSNVAYEVQRSDSWVRMSRTGVMASAATRLITGRGPFVIYAEFRKPASDEHTDPLRRRRALQVISHLLGEMHIGNELSVRNGKHVVVFRVRAVAAIDQRRVDMAANARWGIQHAGSIHYSQDRPIDYHFQDLPWTADCSGSTCAYAKDARIPDPSGSGYNGAGSTDSILANLRQHERKSIRDAQLADLVLWAYGTDGQHVAVVIEPGRDPLLASHGSENGPVAVRFSVEDRFHASKTSHVLDVLGKA